MKAMTFRRLLAGSLAFVLLIALAMTASAHENREVGDYELTVGFVSEPALVNEPNGLDLRVQVGTEEDGAPVEGLQETLEAEVTYAGETKPLVLRGRFGQPGAYTSDIFPTAEGAYTFRIFGTIEGLEIDESFTSGPETFGEVQSTSDIAFPAAEGSADDDASAAVTEAQDAADSARTLAIIGITLSVISLAAVAGGVIGVMKAARAGRASTGPVTRQADDESG